MKMLLVIIILAVIQVGVAVVIKEYHVIPWVATAGILAYSCRKTEQRRQFIEKQFREYVSKTKQASPVIGDKEVTCKE